MFSNKISFMASGSSLMRSVSGYEIRGSLGQGAFGKIFLGVDQNNKKVAIKKEKGGHHHSRLAIEANLYKAIGGSQGIPELHFFVQEGDTCYLGIELLGPNIAELTENLGKTTLSLKSVLMIADQLLTVLQILHHNSYIHCDIKPENLVIGHRQQSRFIYLIDYGLARRFRDPQTLEHYQETDTKAFYGTGRYASINAHKQRTLSRRDDIESLAYLLIYLLKGSLPWMGIKGYSPELQMSKIQKIKETMPISELCKGLPDEFQTFLASARELKFDEEPPYSFYRSIFRNLFIKSNMVYDYMYDWMSLPSDKRKIHTKHKSEPQKISSPILSAGATLLSLSKRQSALFSSSRFF